MRLCRVESIRPGMHLAEHIYLDDGRLLAAAGTALTQDGINIISAQGFTTLVIHKDDTEDIEVPEVIPAICAAIYRYACAKPTTWFGAV